ncbi:MAG: NfeD family protein [Lachnospiraceae bacterium]|nr:NfeD family protein [Lachnospiraceae bacterium]
MTAVYWLIAGAVLCVLEMITITLTCIWFAGGAVIAAIAAQIGLPLIVQLIIFAIVSVVLLIMTRPIAARYVNEKTKKTNIDALVGQHQTVAETIDPTKNQGKIIIGDVEWGAKPADGKSIIEEGTEVVITEISGVKLVVEPVDEVDEEIAETEVPEETETTEVIDEEVEPVFEVVEDEPDEAIEEEPEVIEIVDETDETDEIEETTEVVESTEPEDPVPPAESTPDVGALIKDALKSE